MRSSSVSAIVLAAGASERLGSRNKLLLDYGGKPMVAHTVETVLATGVDDVVVVVGHEADRVRAVLSGYPVTFARNDRYMEGMTTSIHAGVLAARQDAVGYMICLADLPLIEASEFEQLIRAFLRALESDERSIVVPFHDGRRGNPVIFSAHYRASILAHEGLTGCRGLIKQNRDRVVEVEMKTDHVVVDIDTPAEWSGAQSQRSGVP